MPYHTNAVDATVGSICERRKLLYRYRGTYGTHGGVRDRAPRNIFLATFAGRRLSRPPPDLKVHVSVEGSFLLSGNKGTIVRVTKIF